MYKLTFDTTELGKALDEAVSKNFRPFLKEAGSLVMQAIRGRMAEGVDPDGKAYHELIGSYPGRKAAAGFGGKPILTATGSLAKSLITHDRGSDETQVTVASVIHAPIPGLTNKSAPMSEVALRHELGGYDPSDPFRPRPIFGVTEKDIEQILALFVLALDPELS